MSSSHVAIILNQQNRRQLDLYYKERETNMSDFPPNLCLRPLTIEDIDQCIDLEKKGFPEEERCTPEKFKYRLTVCPELCSGLFIREYDSKYNGVNVKGPSDKVDDSSCETDKDEDKEDLPELPVKSSVVKETLIGQIIATKIHGDRITESCMELPSESNDLAGHKESSRHVGIHGFVVDPEWRGKNLGTLLIHDYIQKLLNQDIGDKILIICHKGLVPFYEKIGFQNLGESNCKFAETKWYDMSIDLIPTDDM